MEENWFERAGLNVVRAGKVFHVDLPVRWGDLDALGHVDHGVVLDYLQEARVDFLVDGGVTRMLEEGVLATGHTIQYRAPIRWSPEPVRVHIVMLDRGRARFRVGYLVTHDGEVCAVAASTMVPFDVATQRPRRISAEELSWFEPHEWEITTPFRELPRLSLHGRGHVLPVQTRWSDVDRQDHVNNVKMLDYFQESRVVLTSGLELHKGVLPWAVAQQEVEYVNQMRFSRTPYQVTTAVTGLGGSSFTVASEITEPESGTLVSRCRMALVRVDEAGSPVRIPDHVRDQLTPWLVEG